MEKICLNCGTKIKDGSINFCPSCGHKLGTPEGYTSDLLTIAKIFMIITCVLFGLMLIPLAWLIPMTCRVCKREKDSEKISTSFKICTLIFANPIAGILLLCDEEA